MNPVIGVVNPFGLIQNAGRKKKKTLRRKTRKLRKTRKYKKTYF
jgi:hypothetical protein